MPLHAPDQPTKCELVPAAAVSVTWVPDLKLALHVFPQLMPAGLLVTVPVPVPARATVSSGKGGKVLKVAVTERSLDNVALQTPMPLQAPDHPAKKELLIGAAVSVTWDPSSKLAVQASPQLIPAGSLLTVPFPVPAG